MCTHDIYVNKNCTFNIYERSIIENNTLYTHKIAVNVFAQMNFIHYYYLVNVGYLQ